MNREELTRIGGLAEDARAELQSATGIEPTIDVEGNVRFFASAGSVAYRSIRRDGLTLHAVSPGGLIEPRKHRKAASIAARVDAASELIDRYAEAEQARRVASETYYSRKFWHLVKEGETLERHATERGAELALSRHPGATIAPPQA